MSKPSVFLSYSHKDEDWKIKLRSHLKVLEQVGTFVVWDDRKIDAGETWYDEIRAAMDSAAVAVCLISADYLASDFCAKEEIPYLLKRRSEAGMRLMPVLLRPCAWKFVPWLKAIQMLPRDGKAVAVEYGVTWDVAFDQVVETIAEGLQEEAREDAVRSFELPQGALEGVFRSLPLAPMSLDDMEPLSPPIQVETSRLPIIQGGLFGRAGELLWLDGEWKGGAVRIASIIGPKGSGKTALVARWLEAIQMDEVESYRPQRVFGWSFLGDASSTAFLSAALQWFGDDAPSAGSLAEQGERLGALVAKERTILILEGLRNLDPALTALLAALARLDTLEPCLAILTSREPLDLDRMPAGSVGRKELGPLPPEAGRAMLRVAGVRGTDAELEEISREVGGLPADLARRARR